MSTPRPDKEVQNLQEENQRLRRLIGLAGSVAQGVASNVDLLEVFQRLIDTARDLTGARYGAVGVFDQAGRIVEFITRGVTPEERRLLGELPQGLGILGLLRETQKPLRLRDISQHPRSAGFPPNHPTMKTFLGAPIRDGNEILGNLYLTEKEGGEEFTLEDEELIVILANQSAPLIRSTRLYQSADAERRWLSEVLNGSAGGIITVDALSGKIQVNRRAEEILGRAIDPDIGFGALDAVFADGGGLAYGHDDGPIHRALRGEPMVGHECTVIRPDGSMVPVVCSAGPIRDASGSVIGAVVQFQDMTPIKEAQRQVAELAAERGRLLELATNERRRIEAIIDLAPVGIVLMDPVSTRVLTANYEAERIYGPGFGPGSVLEEHEGAIFYAKPDGTAYAKEELPHRRALAGGGPIKGEQVRCTLPDGRTMLTLHSAASIYSSDGGVTAAIAVIQDITPLEEIERLRGEFLGIVSHELRTPLTAIKGSASIGLSAEHRSRNPEIHELFQIIDEQVDRLSELVDNLLDVTRIEAGVFAVSAAPMDLVALLEEAQATFPGTGAQRLVIRTPEIMPMVKADSRRVRQVISNLLGNAAKFSAPSAPIVISAERMGDQVVVRVEDSGRGIASDQIPRLFRKFSRIHGSTDRAGTGLGLTICKGIVEAHGGRIWAESAGEGRGSTFSFTLPAALDIPQTSPAEVTRRAGHLGRVRRPGQRARILAADDQLDVLRYLRRTLEGAGYEPIVTQDPAQLNRVIETEEPDLVLLDIGFPTASGFDLLKRIREFSGVPVIFVTGRDRPEDTVRALRMGADDYITKPFSSPELLARIEASLRRRVLPDQLEKRPPFALGALAIDFATRQVSVGGQPVKLSATEYKLLYELATNAGLVLTHEQILHRVWGTEYSKETGVVRSCVRDLRRKLGDDARNPRYILTEPQVGYRVPRP